MTIIGITCPHCASDSEAGILSFERWEGMTIAELVDMVDECMLCGEMFRIGDRPIEVQGA